jgi:hypothetical protein
MGLPSGMSVVRFLMLEEGFGSKEYAKLHQ